MAPSSFVDVHCHLAPGIDDGPESLAEAVLLCRQAATEGCFGALATVHQRGQYPQNGRDAIFAAVEKLRQHLVYERIPLQVRPSAEWLIDSSWFELPDPIVDLVTMSDGGKYALLEFPGNCPHHTDIIVKKLEPFGIRPVLAHVDRYPELLFDVAQVQYLVEDGFIVQMNSDSIDGRLGEEPQTACRRLIQAGLVHLVASDGHREEARPIRLKAAFETVSRWTDPATAELLFAKNPLAIWEGTDISKPPGVSLLKRWLKR